MFKNRSEMQGYAINVTNNQFYLLNVLGYVHTYVRTYCTYCTYSIAIAIPASSVAIAIAIAMAITIAIAIALRLPTATEWRCAHRRCMTPSALHVVPSALDVKVFRKACPIGAGCEAVFWAQSTIGAA